MKKSITITYDFGAEVQLKTEPEIKRIITGIILRPNGSKTYECACGLDTSWHQDVEIEKFPDTKRVGGFRGNNGK